MNTLVIYDSLYGNTEKIAQAIADGVGQARVIRASDAGAIDWPSVELLIIGSPTHGGRPSQPLQKFLNTIPPGSLSKLRAVTFDTGIPPAGQNLFVRMIIKFFGYAATRTAAIVKSKGATVISAETFFVIGKEGPLKDGELERARQWGRSVAEGVTV